MLGRRGEAGLVGGTQHAARPRAVGTHLEDGALDVGISDALDVAIAHFLVPDLGVVVEEEEEEEEKEEVVYELGRGRACRQWWGGALRPVGLAPGVGGVGTVIPVSGSNDGFWCGRRW